MACCAFAVFLLGQLYAAFEVCRRLLGFKEAPMVVRDGAASWRPGAAAAPVSRTLPTAYLVAGAGIAAILPFAALSLHASSADPSIAAYLAQAAHWCGPGGA